MQNTEKQRRIKDIYGMLLEIANGNLTFRMPLNGQDTAFDELATLLNQVAEKMGALGYANPYNNNKIDVETAKEATTMMVQKVQEYIVTHLEEPLPSTKKLSAMFSTNEFTLKESFRRFLKTSIYQFYNEERLKKAHLLIQQTNLPLKEIAFMCGFNDYISFYKSFKKRYHYAPSALLRNTQDASDLTDNQ